jgi:16S rRNA C967 or C1407 C5-methylase (RsmB/RsmF family)
MSEQFRRYHLLELLSGYETQNMPLDYYVSLYFRAHKALGSKDRAWISETLYALIRWKGLYDYLLPEDSTWGARLDLFCQKKPETFLYDPKLPLHIRCSFPEELFRKIVASWGEEDAFQIALALNTPAPTVVRTNTLKISRDKLLALFSSHGFEVSPCREAPAGILFHKKINFFGLDEFRHGFFEVQDEASQLVADLAPIQSGDLVLDFCAGSGGKTLAFAPKLGAKGQVYLHDVRKKALLEARRRLARAGIQNAQIIASDELAKLKKLKKKMDVVFVDAPCTGTGTLRRNPDMKWKFSTAMLERLEGQVRHIFEQALSYVKPGGHIVYATCSILREENQNQVGHFLHTYPLVGEGPVFQTVPRKGDKDGFFAICFRKKETI